jgi:hypothetical protein
MKSAAFGDADLGFELCYLEELRAELDVPVVVLDFVAEQLGIADPCV